MFQIVLRVRPLERLQDAVSGVPTHPRPATSLLATATVITIAISSVIAVVMLLMSSAIVS
jgi:hypothetical protein